MTVTLIEPTVADDAKIAALFRESFVETFGHLYAAEDLAAFLATKAEDDFAVELADPAFHFQLALDAGGKALGFVKLGPPDFPVETPPATVELRQIYVLEIATGQGIGAQLMDWATERAQSLGATHLQLSVYTDNHRARRFYTKRGYAEIGSYRFMVGNHADEDIIMRVALSVDVVRAGILGGIPHGFLGRRGGASTGIVAGLNVGSGSGDDPAAVAENVRRATEAVMPGASLARVYQIHSADCVVAEAWPMDARPKADALVTDRPGLLLGIVTADCAPVLLADAEAGVVGAAHAGWRGAIDGVTDAAIAAMERLGARRERIVAAVGPCIAQASYEVGESFRDRFAQADFRNHRFFAEGPSGKPHFDLAAYLFARLHAAGIAQVEATGLDTYADPDRFYSFRRATHRDEADYGRQFSLIGLAP